MDANLRGGVVDGAAKHEGDPPPPPSYERIVS